MIVTPLRPRSIYIPLESSFDATYPIDLNGIISPDEFQESMNRINHSILCRRKKFRIVWIVLPLVIIFGLCFIIGAKRIAKPDTTLNTVLFVTGICSFDLGLLFCCITCCVKRFQGNKKLLQAVSKESNKYSCKSPIPCVWRLECSNTMVARDSNEFTDLVIDIGHSMIPEGAMHHSDQANLTSVSLFQQKNDYLRPPSPSYPDEVTPISTSLFQHEDNSSSLPPRYSDQYPRFCSQCNSPRSYLTANFCSSCGHSFYK